MDHTVSAYRWMGRVSRGHLGGKTMPSYYTERLQQIANDYMEQFPGPATRRQIAAWALETKRWQPQHGTLIAQLAEELSRAMREEYIMDPQGRSVRAKHAARMARDGQQMTLWGDIRNAGREFMEVALQQRRRQIVGDCRQLKLDADSYNENKNPGPPIQLIFDFRADLAELDALDALAS